MRDLGRSGPPWHPEQCSNNLELLLEIDPRVLEFEEQPVHVTSAWSILKFTHRLIASLQRFPRHSARRRIQ